MLMPVCVGIADIEGDAIMARGMREELLKEYN